jgi:hypothetical protein
VIFFVLLMVFFSVATHFVTMYYGFEKICWLQYIVLFGGSDLYCRIDLSY